MIAHDKCNLHNSVVIRSEQLKEVAESLPDVIYVTMQKKNESQWK